MSNNEHVVTKIIQSLLKYTLLETEPKDQIKSNERTLPSTEFILNACLPPLLNFPPKIFPAYNLCISNYNFLTLIAHDMCNHKKMRLSLEYLKPNF